MEQLDEKKKLAINRKLLQVVCMQRIWKLT